MSFSKLDAWIVGALLADVHLNGEVERASAPVRRLADLLRPVPEAERFPRWEAFLAAQDDPQRYINAIADADPASPAPGPEEETAAGPRAKVVKASMVTTKAVEWLWDGRVPLGTLTLFAGDPKLGKSLVSTGMAATTSKGAAHPGAGGDASPAGSVIIMSAEDDPARTIVPRLKAAKADLDRVHLLEAVYLADGAEALPNLRADIDAIAGAVERVGDCRLVIIDPVSAYLGSTDDHKNSELRGVLSPLKALAERLDVAVVLVSHLNKGAGTNAKYRVSGSIAYVGACRANFLFVKDKDDPTGQRVLFLPVGCNLGPEPPGLAYVIKDRGHGPAVEWEAETVSVKVEDALAAAAEDDHERDERKAADERLRGTLAKGSVAHEEIVKAGRTAGFHISSLNRAKRRIGAVTDRDGFGPGSKCSWTLPDQASQSGSSSGDDGPIDFGEAP